MQSKRVFIMIAFFVVAFLGLLFFVLTKNSPKDVPQKSDMSKEIVMDVSANKDISYYDNEVSKIIESEDSLETRSLDPSLVVCEDKILDRVEKPYSGYHVEGSDNTKLNDEKIKTLTLDRFTVVNGCLYDNGEKKLKYSFDTYLRTDFFGKNYLSGGLGESMAESSEWFRFENAGKLYIFLQGGVTQLNVGPYLVIDQTSGIVEGGNIPGGAQDRWFISPNKNRAIIIDNFPEGNDKSIVRLYVYEFTTGKQRQIFQLPENRSITFWGDGPLYGGISWIDDTKIKVDLYEKDPETGNATKNDEMNSNTKLMESREIDIN